MKRSIATASAVALAALAAALAWLLVAGAQLAGAGGPNPLLLREPRAPAEPASASTLAVSVILVVGLLSAALVFGLVQRRADSRATQAEVKLLTAQDEQDHERKAA